jgi:hypothetical protein
MAKTTKMKGTSKTEGTFRYRVPGTGRSRPDDASMAERDS